MFRAQLKDILSSPIDFTNWNSRDNSIGQSVEGREIFAYRFGSGPKQLSCIAGCHADEPVGPHLLRHLVSYLDKQDPESEMLQAFTWWVVPHVNPDGEYRNSVWQQMNREHFDLVEYLESSVRELPGADIEFGFPRDSDDSQARPENRALANWWNVSFDLHLSLHGMAFAGGPWFLIDRNWVGRCESLLKTCASRVQDLGYKLHDVERHGEKGFTRICRGFCTHPDSELMRAYFLQLEDPDTAGLFRPSSMEYVRSLGGDPLTLVSEMPLFIVPGIGEQIFPCDPVADRWNEWVVESRAGIVDHESLSEFDVSPMPIEDQIKLQWEFICSGIDLIIS